MKIKIHVSIGLVGCRREATIDVEDDATEDEIDEIAQEAMFEMISWGWCRADDAKARTTRRSAK